MPYSPELGMRVFDPQEGARAGQIAGQAFTRAFEGAQNRELEERKLAMLEAETRRKAALLNLQQMGLAELRNDIANNVPFQDALFKAGPKLFADKPEAIAQAIDNRARLEATQKYRESTLNLRREAAQSLDTYREKQLLKPPAAVATAEAIGRATRDRDALQTRIKTNPNDIDLHRMLGDTEAKIQALQGTSRGSSSAPAPIAIAREMTTAKEEVKKARASGDKAALEKAEGYLSELEKAQSLSNRDPRLMASLGVIKSAIGAIDRQLHGNLAIALKPEEKANLIKERAALIEQLKSEGITLPTAVEATPEPSTSPSGRSLRWTGSEFVPK